MRVLSKKYVVNFYNKHPTSKSSLEAFLSELKSNTWEKPNDVIGHYPTADLITSKRFVFNIKGNTFRLVADIDFTHKIVFIVWIGTHANYDKINVRTIEHDKSD